MRFIHLNLTTRLILLLLVIGLAVQPVSSSGGALALGGHAPEGSSLEDDFRAPPLDSRPWCYWYWISNNISKEGVTKDLEAMARVGIGTALIGNQYFPVQPEGEIPLLSEEFWEVMVHAVREGQRVGVDIGVFNCPGWSMSGGPWVKPEQAMRYLTRSEKLVQGPVVFNETLPDPGQHFQEVAVLAIPVNEASLSLAQRDPQAKTNAQDVNAAHWFDGDLNTKATILPQSGQEPVQVEISVKESFVVRSLTLLPGDGYFRTRVKVEAKVDGDFKVIGEGLYDRRNPGIATGVMPKGEVVIEVAETQSDQFRLTFTPPEFMSPRDKTSSLAEIDLSSSARVAYHVEKQLGKMYPLPLPLWGSYLWPEALPGNEQGSADNPDEVLNPT